MDPRKRFKRDADNLHQHCPRAKVTLVDLDRNRLHIAQYNPKELQVDKAASWEHAETDKGDHPELTFKGSGARTLAMELFFDTYEQGRDVHALHVGPLTHLLDVIDPKGPEALRRPPRVMMVWGGELPTFIGVLESVSTKYTMFLPCGTPVRATCSVKLTEASRHSWRTGAMFEQATRELDRAALSALRRR